MLIARYRATTCAIVGIAMLSAAASVDVDSQPIDVEQSTLTVHVYKTGLFSAFADNHVVRAPIAGGRISEDGTLAVELTVKAAQMTVLDPTLSAEKRAEVQARMHGVPRQYSDCGETPTRRCTPRPNEDGSSADDVDHDGEPPPARSIV